MYDNFDAYDDFFPPVCWVCGIREPDIDGLCYACIDEDEEDAEFDDWHSYGYGLGTRVIGGF